MSVEIADLRSYLQSHCEGNISLRESIATTMDDEIAFADVRVASIFSPDEQGMEFNAGAGDAFHLDDIEAAMHFLWEKFNHGTTIAANAMYAFFINHTLELDAQELVTMARARDGTLLFGARQRPLPYHERYVLNLKIVLHIGGYDEIINPRETIKALIHVLPGVRECFPNLRDVLLQLEWHQAEEEISSFRSLKHAFTVNEKPFTFYYFELLNAFCRRMPRDLKRRFASYHKGSSMRVPKDMDAVNPYKSGAEIPGVSAMRMMRLDTEYKRAAWGMPS